MNTFIKVILTLIMIAPHILFASAQKDTSRIYLPTDPTSFSMILLDTKLNKPVTKEIYNFIESFREVNATKLAKAANLDKKVGFINEKGEWIVPAQLDYARNFTKEGIARVQIAKKWGYIHSDGSWLVKPKFAYANPFYEGIGLVQEGSRDSALYFIDTSAKRLSDQNFSSARSFCHDGSAAVAMRHTIKRYEIYDDKVLETTTKSQKEYWGKIDTHGKIILPLTLTRKDPQLKCPPLKKEKRTKEDRPGLVQRKSHWGLLPASKKFVPFPEHIVSIFADLEDSISAYHDGIFTVVTKDRTLEYYDANLTLHYMYKPDSNNKMTLFDASGSVIYRTDIDAFKIYTALNRGVDELFVDPSDYNASRIITGIEKMLKKQPTRYQVPNLLFEAEDRDPYKITDSNDNVKEGRIWVLARGYVSETAWGINDYLLDYESSQFSTYTEEIAKWISAKYGEPISAKYGTYVWVIQDKILKLDTASDTGDGDFYNLLAIEIFKKEQ